MSWSSPSRLVCTGLTSDLLSETMLRFSSNSFSAFLFDANELASFFSSQFSLLSWFIGRGASFLLYMQGVPPLRPLSSVFEHVGCPRLLVWCLFASLGR